jgi:hypothetical protein
MGVARFPLPFHHNAFFVAMADHWVGIHAPELLFPFADAIFARQVLPHNTHTEPILHGRADGKPLCRGAGGTQRTTERYRPMGPLLSDAASTHSDSDSTGPRAGGVLQQLAE